MRRILPLLLLAAVTPSLLRAEEAPPAAPTAVTAPPLSAEEQMGRGEQINRAFVTLTGQAVNPLFGITAGGVYSYFATPSEHRASLPAHAQPYVWVPLLLILLLMAFNSTLCEAFPPLKTTLNALGDFVNKGGAILVLPIVLSQFAHAFQRPAAVALQTAWQWALPVAYAGETAETLWLVAGWIASITVGLAAYAAVWVVFNVVDVAILVSPFPGVDAFLKSCRLLVVGMLAVLNYAYPPVAFLVAVLLLIICAALAGWAFRLSLFGAVFALDILLFRKNAQPAGNVLAFSMPAAKARWGLPARTMGRLARNAETGRLAFSHRPWLVRPRRTMDLGEAMSYECGSALLHPFLIHALDNQKAEAMFRLPPRYRGSEAKTAESLGLKGARNVSLLRGMWSWLTGSVTLSTAGAGAGMGAGMGVDMAAENVSPVTDATPAAPSPVPAVDEPLPLDTGEPDASAGAAEGSAGGGKHP